MSFIKVENLIFDYFRRDDSGNVETVEEALRNVNLQVKKGDFVSIVGENGSGKSTLARNINALLFPTEGSVFVDGMDTAEPDLRVNIRKTAGMVFQNPDSQLVSAVVEDDIAFGPENLGMAQAEMAEAVDEALRLVNMEVYRHVSPEHLSGGQKQKIAIAGVLAMRPKCLILDEATSMLPPADRRQLLALLHDLNREQGMTVLHITHYMDEIIDSDVVFAMSRGEIVFEGKAEQLFARSELMQTCRLLPPFSFSVKHSQPVLLQEGIAAFTPEAAEAPQDMRRSLIINDGFFGYPEGNGKRPALSCISLSIAPGERIGITGRTGSGKSTLLQLLDGLIRPDKGEVYLEGQNIWDKDFDSKLLRQKVGLVFQYPEHQLFEETVFRDVVFGPHHLPLPKVEAEKRAFEAILAMGLGEESFDLSPLSLSCGMKRKVALAGVLAMEPEFLLLDEPAAGLDPMSKRELFEMLMELQRERGFAIVFVSHDMNTLAEYADRLVVVKDGGILLDEEIHAAVRNREVLADAGLELPDICCYVEELREKGYPLPTDIIRETELRQVLAY